MIEKGFLGLYCDAAEHPEDDEPAYLEWGFQDQDELRKKACEDGWTTVRFPGAPWRNEDRCPEHPAKKVESPQNTVEVRG